MTEAKWTWAAACCRGVSHQKANIRLQDAFTCGVARAPTQPITILVSDGAGSASFGGEGASLTCRTISTQARRHYAAIDSFPDDATLESWIDAARDRIAAVAARRQLLPRDFAATVVLALSNGLQTVTLHIGDGCVVVKDAEQGSWIAPTWPDHGEYASTTSFITDEPAARVRISRHSGAISAIAVFSDGLERLVLDLHARTPYARFFDQIIAPVTGSPLKGKDRDLSRDLATFLDSTDVNNRTDDDKTLVLAVCR